MLNSGQARTQEPVQQTTQRVSRCFALSKQERLSDDQLAELIAHLSSSSGQVRWAAAWSLAQAKQLPVSAISELTKSNDLQVRRAATYVLSERAGDSFDAYTALLPVRTDQDALVRRLALDGLYRVGAKRTELIPALVAALQPPQRTSTGGRIPDSLLTVLEQLDPPTRSELPALIELLKHESATVRQFAHRQLLRTEESLGPHYDQVVSAYEDGRVPFDQTAGEHFGDSKHHRDRIAEIIIATFDADPSPIGPDWLVRLAIDLDVAGAEIIDRLVKQLQTTTSDTKLGGWIGELAAGSDELIADVAKLLQHPQQHVRVAALVAIAEIGPDAAATIPSLRNMLKSDHHNESLRAAIALYSIGPAAQQAAEDLWETHPVVFNHSASFRMKPARYSVGMFAESVLPIVLPLVERPDYASNQTTVALQVLADIGASATAAVPALQNILTSSVPEDPTHPAKQQRAARVLAAQALARISPREPDLVKDMLVVLDDEDQIARRVTLFKLLLAMQPDHPEVLSRLNQHMQARDRCYRQAALLLATHGRISAATIAQVYDQRSRRRCAELGKDALQRIALDETASYQARDHAARSLATLDIGEHPQLSKVFAALLSHPARDLRNFAASTLVTWGEHGWTPLPEILKTPNTDAWHTVVAQLDQFGPLAQRAIPVLEQVAESSPESKPAAMRALRKIRRSEFAVAGQTRFADHYPVFQASLPTVLQQIQKSPADVPALRQLRFFGPAAAPFLANIVVDKERTAAVRRAAVPLLVDPRCVEYHSALITVLQDYSETDTPAPDQRQVALAVCRQLPELTDVQSEAKRLVRQLIDQGRFPPAYERYLR
jgi:HEAT repeat protein